MDDGREIHFSLPFSLKNYYLNCNIKSDRMENFIRRAISEDFAGKIVEFSTLAAETMKGV